MRIRRFILIPVFRIVGSSFLLIFPLWSIVRHTQVSLRGYALAFQGHSWEFLPVRGICRSPARERHAVNAWCLWHGSSTFEEEQHSSARTKLIVPIAVLFLFDRAYVPTLKGIAHSKEGEEQSHTRAEAPTRPWRWLLHVNRMWLVRTTRGYATLTKQHTPRHKFRNLYWSIPSGGIISSSDLAITCLPPTCVFQLGVAAVCDTNGWVTISRLSLQ